MRDAFMKELMKYSLKNVVVDFEFHLDEEDVVDAERIDENVRIIEIPHTQIEFGFETDLDDKQIVDIVFGYAKLSLPRKALIRAYDDWMKRDELVRKELTRKSK